MNRKLFLLITVLWFLGGMLVFKTVIPKTLTTQPIYEQARTVETSSSSSQAPRMTGSTCDGECPPGCSVFTIAKGDQVFFGGNDDYINPDSYYWVDPGNAKNFGVIWVGTPDNVQQGVNEKGLAYDANGLPTVDVNPHLEREPVGGDYNIYPIRIMHECASVEEVINWVKTHQWHSYMHDQMHFADASGDAVIISAGADGEIVFTRKPSGDGFLVSTNFNVANHANGNYPDPRDVTATEMLGKLVNQAGPLTYRDAVKVLDAVHVESTSSWTLESLVADLPNGTVYLYYFYQYDRPVIFNVAEEIANKRSAGPLSKLFPEDVRQEAVRRYEHIQLQRTRYELLGRIWFYIVLGSLMILVLASLKTQARLIFWLPVVIILGPVGLLIWLVTRRAAANWQVLLIEAAGDVLPTVVAFIAVTSALVLRMGAPELVTISLYFGTPFIVGWLLFQGILLAIGTHRNYGHILLKRFLHSWVAANIGIAILFPIGVPLVNASIQIPLHPWTVIYWWGLTAICALACMLLLLGFESWCVKRGFRAWSKLVQGENEIVSAPWKQAWWWILVSYVISLAGLVAFVFLQNLIST